MTTPRGAHLLIECRECAPARLDDVVHVEQALRRAADAIGARVVAAAFHRFQPQGVTGFLLLEESHLSIHTWPERGYAAIDLYTCGAGDPQLAVGALTDALACGKLELVRVERGRLELDRALHVRASNVVD
jgi:S-adenosylmethionine decarboxylase proenzyme